MNIYSLSICKSNQTSLWIIFSFNADQEQIQSVDRFIWPQFCQSFNAKLETFIENWDKLNIYQVFSGVPVFELEVAHR